MAYSMIPWPRNGSTWCTRTSGQRSIRMLSRRRTPLDRWDRLAMGMGTVMGLGTALGTALATALATALVTALAMALAMAVVGMVLGMAVVGMAAAGWEPAPARREP